MNALGVKPTITKGFRTAAEQQALRKNPGNYPVAKGASWHQAAQAVDFDHYDRNFPIIHAIMAKHGFVWGGGYGDPVHFQLAPKGTNPDSSLLDKVGGN